MRYRPTSCEGCQSIELLPVDSSAERATRCPSCSGIARIVPGCVYAEGDLPLFNELSRAVARGAIMAVEAQRMVIDIERACAVDEVTAVLGRIVRRLPMLDPVRLMLEVYPQRQKQALVMLGTILNATTLKQRSGTMATHRTAIGVSVAKGERQW